MRTSRKHALVYSTQQWGEIVRNVLIAGNSHSSAWHNPAAAPPGTKSDQPEPARSRFHFVTVGLFWVGGIENGHVNVS